MCAAYDDEAKRRVVVANSVAVGLLCVFCVLCLCLREILSVLF